MLRREPFLHVLLAAAIALVYAPVARFDFVDFDDGAYVYENPRVLAGLTARGVAWAFANREHAIWDPLTWLSHMLDVELFGARGAVLGLPASGWHHLTNVGLHAAGTLLLLRCLCAATGNLLRSAFVAGVFALHPLHVESVAWVAERKDVLSGALGFASLAAWVAWTRRGGAARYALALALLALGLLAKPMLVTWPLVLLLLDLWPLGRLRVGAASPAPGAVPLRALLIEKLPFLALAAAAGVVAWIAQRPAMELQELVPLPARAANAAASLFLYMRRALWPSDLAALYPFRAEQPAALVAAGALVALGGTAAALLALRRRPAPAVGWLWFAVTLAPVSGLVQFGQHALADRFTYVPLVGLALAAAWLAPDLAGSRPAARLGVAAAGVAALFLCALGSARQLVHWRDTEALFRRALAVTEDNAIAHNALGKELARQGRADAAIAELREAVRLLPRFADALESLGLALEQAGRGDEALPQYRAALETDPGSARLHGRVGAALLARGELAAGEASLREAVRLAPGDAAARSNLATALALQGRFAEAVEEFRAALALDAGLDAARLFLARALAEDGRPAEALAQYRELAARHAGAGRFGEAAAAAAEGAGVARDAGDGAAAQELARELARYRAAARGGAGSP